MLEKIIILDFGSPTTQLIGRRIRELNQYCEILPYNKFPQKTDDIKGVILSGSPYSVHDSDAFEINLNQIRKKFPLLAIGYGAQFMVYAEGGKIERSKSRRLNKDVISCIDENDSLMQGIAEGSQIWMSYSDTIDQMPNFFKTIANSHNVDIAAYKIEGEKTWGVQFHPEVFHTLDGALLLENFLRICECKRNWSPELFVESTVAALRKQIGDEKVILALSGGVDSSVAAVLLHRAIGRNLVCVFVDHGFLRKDEFENVLHDYKNLSLNLIAVDAKDRFFKAVKGVADPEEKRKIIGKTFIDIFEEEAKKIRHVKWLAQGTIYPDVIESISVMGDVIKSHHNVGGLPEKMKLKLCEPLRLLFKNEVRQVGYELGMMHHSIKRHPFPGPGLAVRVLGEVTPQRIKILQEADAIFIDGLKEWNLYDKVWQAATILLPVQSVGMSENKRTYENAVVLRAVTSTDAMTAEWARLPNDFLTKISNDIISRVKGVNRVVYDISSKPPATIEWE